MTFLEASGHQKFHPRVLIVVDLVGPWPIFTFQSGGGELGGLDYLVFKTPHRVTGRKIVREIQ